MKILIIGAGVLGCNLATNLFEAGKDVTLLARGNWYNEIKENGLKIKNKFSLRTKTYQINLISELKPEEYYDVIFVSLRFTQIHSVFEMLNQNCSKNIVFNGNNTRVEDIIKNLPDKNVMFSFSLSAGLREESRVNSIDFKKITIGDLKGNDNRSLVKDIFAGTKYKTVYEPNMKDYLLSHASYIITVVFACYYTDGNLKKIKNDKKYITKIIKANIEANRALEKLGIEILPEEDRAYETKKWFNTVMFLYRLMFGSFMGKLFVADHAMNAKDEMNILAEDIKAIIDKAGTGSEYFDELWIRP